MAEKNTEYVAIKALSRGVQIIGLTRGNETRPLHTEVLDAGEVILFQFTENTSAVKIRGNAEILTAFGKVESEKRN